mmetsp:Transcript_12643/g.16727  ORF Transcript_12643/g.16727 Transcript_12643/m.16727 type:complete len:81 (-) Transcript_12643:1062-1304(-)
MIGIGYANNRDSTKPSRKLPTAVQTCPTTGYRTVKDKMVQSPAVAWIMPIPKTVKESPPLDLEFRAHIAKTSLKEEYTAQ